MTPQFQTCKIIKEKITNHKMKLNWSDPIEVLQKVQEVQFQERHAYKHAQIVFHCDTSYVREL